MEKRIDDACRKENPTKKEKQVNKKPMLSPGQNNGIKPTTNKQNQQRIYPNANKRKKK